MESNERSILQLSFVDLVQECSARVGSIGLVLIGQFYNGLLNCLKIETEVGALGLRGLSAALPVTRVRCNEPDSVTTQRQMAQVLYAVAIRLKGKRATLNSAAVSPANQIRYNSQKNYWCLILLPRLT